MHYAVISVLLLLWYASYFCILSLPKCRVQKVGVDWIFPWRDCVVRWISLGDSAVCAVWAGFSLQRAAGGRLSWAEQNKEGRQEVPTSSLCQYWWCLPAFNSILDHHSRTHALTSVIHYIVWCWFGFVPFFISWPL